MWNIYIYLFIGSKTLHPEKYFIIAINFILLIYNVNENPNNSVYIYEVKTEQCIKDFDVTLQIVSNTFSQFLEIWTKITFIKNI